MSAAVGPQSSVRVAFAPNDWPADMMQCRPKHPDEIRIACIAVVIVKSVVGDEYRRYGTGTCAAQCAHGYRVATDVFVRPAHGGLEERNEKKNGPEI